MRLARDAIGAEYVRARIRGGEDGDWYRFLADRPDVSAAKVNFWRPGGGRGFHALAEGEPFFFKTHAPHNRVVGGGFYSGFAPLRMSEAWQMFRLANGGASLNEMRMRIARYRREPIAPSEDPEIGCVFVRDVTFFPDGMSYDPPPGFAPNIVQGKSYDMADARVSRYFGDLLQLVLGKAIEIDFSQPWHKAGPVFGDPRLAPYRLGQQSWTTDCCCAPTSTRCSTAATSRSMTITACWSGRFPASGQGGLVVSGLRGHRVEEPVRLCPFLGLGEDFPGVGQEDDTLAGPERPHVDLLPVLLRDGP